MDRHGVAEMFDIPGMACKKGTSRHPVSYNRIVIFIECPGGDDLLDPQAE